MRRSTTATAVAIVAMALSATPAALAAPSLMTDSIGPFDAPYGIAVSPDGASVRVLEASGDDAVTYVDAATNAIVGGDVGVGNNPYFGAFDATGAGFFTANYSADTVSVIVDRAVVTTIALPGGSNPYLIKPAIGSTKLVTMNQGAGGTPGVSVIDTATRTVDRTISAGGVDQVGSMAVLPTGTRAWITSSTGVYLKVVDLVTGTVSPITPTLTGGQVPRAVAVSPDGATLALITHNTNELILLNATSGAVTHRIALGTTIPWAAAFSPDGAVTYLLTSTTVGGENPQVTAYASATGSALRTFTLRDGHFLTAGGAPEEWFAITPDGATTFVATDDAGTTAINAVDLRSGRIDVVPLPNFSGDFGYMALNPQGSRLYVSNDQAGSGLLAALSTADAPGTPTGVAATAGDGTARVTWTAPADDGGGAVTRYTATANPGGQSCAWASGDLACTITGLVNGTAYAVTVTATNRAGTSAASAAASVTPGRAPGVPTAVKATAGLLRATVTWKAPADTGGGITGYTATASPGGATCTTTGALTCTITGLLNTKAYTVTVTARSAGGTSAASAKSASVRPYKKLGMRKPTATSSAIRSQVKTSGPGTITQITTNTKNATVCRTTAKPKKQGTTTLTCSPNKATRTALKKKAQTLSILTTLLTKQGASFAATHRVTLPKSR